MFSQGPFKTAWSMLLHLYLFLSIAFTCLTVFVAKTSFQKNVFNMEGNYFGWYLLGLLCFLSFSGAIEVVVNAVCPKNPVLRYVRKQRPYVLVLMTSIIAAILFVNLRFEYNIGAMAMYVLEAITCGSLAVLSILHRRRLKKEGVSDEDSHHSL